MNNEVVETYDKHRELKLCAGDSINQRNQVFECNHLLLLASVLMIIMINGNACDH